MNHDEASPNSVLETRNMIFLVVGLFYAYIVPPIFPDYAPLPLFCIELLSFFLMEDYRYAKDVALLGTSRKIWKMLVAVCLVIFPGYILNRTHFESPFALPWPLIVALVCMVASFADYHSVLLIEFWLVAFFTLVMACSSGHWKFEFCFWISFKWGFMSGLSLIVCKYCKDVKWPAKWPMIAYNVRLFVFVVLMVLLHGFSAYAFIMLEIFDEQGFKTFLEDIQKCH